MGGGEVDPTPHLPGDGGRPPHTSTAPHPPSDVNGFPWLLLACLLGGLLLLLLSCLGVAFFFYWRRSTDSYPEVPLSPPPFYHVSRQADPADKLAPELQFEAPNLFGPLDLAEVADRLSRERSPAHHRRKVASDDVAFDVVWAAERYGPLLRRQCSVIQITPPPRSQ